MMKNRPMVAGGKATLLPRLIARRASPQGIKLGLELEIFDPREFKS